MVHLSWNDGYSVGNAELDRQHSNLLRMISRLGRAVKSSSSEINSELHEILNDLTQYVYMHFEHEERILLQVQYDKFDEHRKMHASYEEIVAGFNLKALTSEIDGVELYDFLKEWLVNHILTEDMAFKSVIAIGTT